MTFHHINSSLPIYTQTAGIWNNNSNSNDIFICLILINYFGFWIWNSSKNSLIKLQYKTMINSTSTSFHTTESKQWCNQDVTSSSLTYRNLKHLHTGNEVSGLELHRDRIKAVSQSLTFVNSVVFFIKTTYCLFLQENKHYICQLLKIFKKWASLDECQHKDNLFLPADGKFPTSNTCILFVTYEYTQSVSFAYFSCCPY